MLLALGLGLVVCALLVAAGPALASHDDYGPGAVVLSERSGVVDRVVGT